MADLPMRYDTRYRWTGKGAEGWIDVEGLDALAVGSPHDAGRFSPEHLFVAAAEICMANFVTLIAERSGLELQSYTSTAHGDLEFEKGADYRFSTIVIRPCLKIPAGAASLAQRVVDKAHRSCLVARSLNCPVTIEAQFEEA